LQLNSFRKELNHHIYLSGGVEEELHLQAPAFFLKITAMIIVSSEDPSTENSAFVSGKCSD
jgi:hypothetical protein